LLLTSACSGGDGEATRTVTVTTATTVTSTATETETETETETVTGAPSPGTLPVEDFNARAESVDEPWERDLQEITRRFLALSEQESGSRSFQSSSSGDRATATLLVDGLGDDSVRARNYELTFERRADGTWRIETATWTQQCHEGRGHQDFSSAPCL
jgi:hypothetical protein